MNRFLAMAAVVLATTAWMGADLAEAKRMGGGRSIGAQRQATPPPAPNTPSAAPTAPAAAGPDGRPGPRRRTGRFRRLALARPHRRDRRWAGPGRPALAFRAVGRVGRRPAARASDRRRLLLVRWLLAKRAPAARPLQYAGAPAGRVEPHVTRPGAAFEPVMGTAASTPAPAAPRRYPAGFDAAAFVDQAKVQFRKLQAAYDTADRKALSEVMTPEMFAEISNELGQREAHMPTEVMQLDADVLEVATEGQQHWMSVRFTGRLREDGTVLPKDFDEIWNLVKPVDGSSGWLLAGIQQTQ